MAIGPASSFKLPLAVMGFDAGILSDPATPEWPYDASYGAVRRVDRQAHTPQSWMGESVLWYSRRLVHLLGAHGFARYVTAFGYGNVDVSGERGANNGLTHSWLNTSLLITPREQLSFVHRLINGNLPVAHSAIAKAMSITPSFAAAEGWVINGKTGTGYVRESDGKLGRRQYGWFIGWASAEQRAPVVFAYLLVDDKSGLNAAGPRARDDLTARWVELVGG